MRTSIVTPSFNSIDFIEACVANVLAQGDVVLEHIIVDGGSTDGTIDAIIALQSRYPHIRYIGGPDGGQSDALNKGVKSAKGEVIGVLNVDDSYEPEAVGRATRKLETIRAPALVVGICKLSGDGSVKWNRPKDLRFEALLLGYDYCQWPNNPAAYFYHKEVHEHVGFYDVNDHYGMDLDFIFRCARLVKMKYVNQHWGNFYLHPGCKTYEDNEGVIRQQRLINRFLSSMSEAEIKRMNRIRVNRTRVLAIKKYFKQFGIFRSLNELQKGDWALERRQSKNFDSESTKLRSSAPSDGS